MMNKYCKTCGFLDPTQPVCRIFRIQVDPNADFCSKHQLKTEVEHCEKCGSPILGGSVLDEKDNELRFLCIQCAKVLNTCASCKMGQTCEFRTNPDPMPQMVNKTIRQGNMIMQQTVPNPSRIEKFCYNCTCFSMEYGCMKQNNCCDGKWEEAI